MRNYPLPMILSVKSASYSLRISYYYPVIQPIDMGVYSTSETVFGLTTAVIVRLKRGVRHQILVG